jgi:hypothetical protein
MLVEETFSFRPTVPRYDIKRRVYKRRISQMNFEIIKNFCTVKYIAKKIKSFMLENICKSDIQVKIYI